MLIYNENKFEINKNLSMEDVDDEIIIYNMETEHIIILNCTATHIWEQIFNSSNDVQLTITDIYNKLSSIYNANPNLKEKIMTDILEIINQFISEKFLCRM